MTQTLHHQIYGEAGDPPVIVAHGLYGSARNWRSLAKRLARGRRIICVDMRNHGASFRSDDMSYAAMADDLIAVAGAYDRPRLIGHSMGGKAAMVAALAAPEAFSALLIADIAPVAYTHVEETRAFARAMLALDLEAVSNRREAEAALTDAVGDAGLATFLAQSLDFDGARPRWVLNLPVLRDAMEAIVGFPDVSGRFDGPALFLSGADSDYVDAAGKAAARELFPAARFAAIKDAGHWLHADQPRAFIASCEAFLAATDP